MGMSDLPDMYESLRAAGPRASAYTSEKTQGSVLQLLCNTLKS